MNGNFHLFFSSVSILFNVPDGWYLQYKDSSDSLRSIVSLGKVNEIDLLIFDVVV